MLVAHEQHGDGNAAAAKAAASWEAGLPSGGSDTLARRRSLEPRDDGGVDQADDRRARRPSSKGTPGPRSRGRSPASASPRRQHGGIIGAHVEAEGEAAGNRGQAMNGGIGVEAAERDGHRNAAPLALPTVGRASPRIRRRPWRRRGGSGAVCRHDRAAR